MAYRREIAIVLLMLIVLAGVWMLVSRVGTASNGADAYAVCMENGTLCVAAGASVSLAMWRGFIAGETAYTSGVMTAEEFSAAGLAGKTLRLFNVSGDFDGDGNLSADLVAPYGALLIAAAYDASGRQTDVSGLGFTETSYGSFPTGLVKTEDWSYKLMLVDQNYAPLCPAWTSSSNYVE